jgi:hypothetical protein
MKDPAPETTRDLNLKSARLFSIFLRGASYLKSPQNIFEKIEVLYRHTCFGFVNTDRSEMTLCVLASLRENRCSRKDAKTQKS